MSFLFAQTGDTAGNNEPSADNDSPTAADTVNQSIDDVSVEVGHAWATVDKMIDGFFAMLPSLVIAVVVFFIFYLLAWVVRWIIQRYTRNLKSKNVGQVIARLAQWVTLLVGLMVAVAIVSPSVTPAKLLSGLGIGGVAIGFAFKDILQNFLAGILILLRQPFDVGDQVKFGSHEGTVETIDTRSTIIKTYDGQRVLIPNGEVYTNPMVVLTAYNHRRTQYDVGIGYSDDISTAIEKMMDAMGSVSDVLTDPAPDVVVSELAGSTVNLRARWWTNPRKADVVRVGSQVIHAIKNAMDDAAIDMPYPTQVMLFHDQTEEADGDRTLQREGWPAGSNPPKPGNMPRAMQRRDQVINEEAAE